MMASLMEKYNLLEFYQNLEIIKKPLEVLETLMKRYLPKIYAHMVILFTTNTFIVRMFAMGVGHFYNVLKI